MLSRKDIKTSQQKWANAITNISKNYTNGEDFVTVAFDAITELYAYDDDEVLFKPTKASETRFRPTKEDALSYFVGDGNVEDGYREDSGFAINGGKCWKDVLFRNHQIHITGKIAIAMGVYEFTCATTNEVITVDYTMGYKRYDDSNVRIFLHHSSVPYSNTCQNY